MTEQISANPDSDHVKGLLGDHFMKTLFGVGGHKDPSDLELADGVASELGSAEQRSSNRKASEFSRRSKLKSTTSRSQTPSRSPDN